MSSLSLLLHAWISRTCTQFHVYHRRKGMWHFSLWLPRTIWKQGCLIFSTTIDYWGNRLTLSHQLTNSIYPLPSRGGKSNSILKANSPCWLLIFPSSGTASKLSVYIFFFICTLGDKISIASTVPCENYDFSVNPALRSEPPQLWILCLGSHGVSAFPWQVDFSFPTHSFPMVYKSYVWL